MFFLKNLKGMWIWMSTKVSWGGKKKTTPERNKNNKSQCFEKSLKAHKESLALSTEGIYLHKQVRKALCVLNLLQVILGETRCSSNALDFISRNRKWDFSGCHISSMSYLHSHLHTPSDATSGMRRRVLFFYFFFCTFRHKDYLYSL